MKYREARLNEEREIELFEAIESSDRGKVQELLDAGVSQDFTVIVKNEIGEEWATSCLHTAMRLDNLEIFKLLLDNGADPNQMIDGGNPIIWEALDGFGDEGKKDPGYIEYLLANGANFNSETKKVPYKYTVFEALLSVRLNYKDGVDSLDLIKLLLDKGANVNTHLLSKGMFRSVIKHAYLEGDVELVKMLLAHKADSAFFGAMHWGSKGINDNLEMFKLFLAYRDTPLKMASRVTQNFKDWLEINEIIREAFLLNDIDVREDFLQQADNLTVLRKARAEDLQSFYESYPAYSAAQTSEFERKIDFQEVLNSSKLFKAIESGDIDKVKKLLDAKENPNFKTTVKNELGEECETSCLHTAMRLGNFEIFKLLLDKGADAKQTIDGNPIIWQALDGFGDEGKKNPEYFKCLLERGAHYQSRIEKGLYMNMSVFEALLSVRLKYKDEVDSLDLIKLLLDKGVDLRTLFLCSDGTHRLAIMSAYLEGDVELVKTLLDHNKADTRFFNSIRWGGAEGISANLEMFKLFLSYSDTPLSVAPRAAQEFRDWFEINKVIREANLLNEIDARECLFQKRDNLTILKKAGAEDLKNFYDTFLAVQTSKVGQKIDFEEVLNTCKLKINFSNISVILSYPKINLSVLENMSQAFKVFVELKSLSHSMCYSVALPKEDAACLISVLEADYPLETREVREQKLKFCLGYLDILLHPSPQKTREDFTDSTIMEVDLENSISILGYDDTTLNDFNG